MKPVLVIGGGGHAAVVIDALRAQGMDIVGALDADEKLHGARNLDIRILGGDDLLADWPPEDVELANGLGGVNDLRPRTAIFMKHCETGYRFASVLHPSTVIGANCSLGKAQIMAGAVLQPRSDIGENTVINTNASVDHDCAIGGHAHVAPGAMLGGGVSVGTEALIGIGASILPNVKIGAHAIVAAGATVVADVPDDTTVAARPPGNCLHDRTVAAGGRRTDGKHPRCHGCHRPRGHPMCLVTDESQRLVGAITDGDIRRAILRGAELDTAVSTIMVEHPYTASVDTAEDALARQMRTRNIRQIPLLDNDGRLVDVAYIDDLLRPAETHPNEVILMAGGRGTRLMPLTDEMPKPMLEIGGRPILETIISRFVDQGFHRFRVSLNYRGDMIQDYFGDGDRLGS